MLVAGLETQRVCPGPCRGQHTLPRPVPPHHLAPRPAARLPAPPVRAAESFSNGLAGMEADELLSMELEEGGTSTPGPPAAAVVTQVAKAVKKNDWALRSVLKVFVVRVDPNYAQPWQKCPQRSASGSAFVIDVEQRLIMTNAHVVANATTVYVRRPGNPKKWRAVVRCMGKPCDLALLSVEEEGFWSPDLRRLTFLHDTPELQSPVCVAGYPVGGDSLSITKGIVSRVTMVRYSQGARLLGIQIDAAINPGNSGGPAFADMEVGCVAGVAFSKNVGTGTDNIGYIIPWAVVDHFLSEYTAHGTHRGLVSPGFYTQPMENPAQQRYLQLPEGASGAVIVKLDPISPAAGVLALADVVLEVEGAALAGDESVGLRDDERVDYWHLVSMKHIGDTLTLKILRQGQELLVSYPLSRQSLLVGVLHEVDCWPSYFIVGGLVFAPLSLPCLEAMYGPRKWRTLAPVAVLSACAGQKAHASQEVVLLVQVLSHEINHGYKYSVVPLETFNGTPVQNLAHLAGLVDACGDPYLNFGLEGGRFVTLAREDVAAAQGAILEANSIPADRSNDLRGQEAAAAAAQAAAYVEQQQQQQEAAAANGGPVTAAVAGGGATGGAGGSSGAGPMQTSSQVGGSVAVVAAGGRQQVLSAIKGSQPAAAHGDGG